MASRFSVEQAVILGFLEFKNHYDTDMLSSPTEDEEPSMTGWTPPAATNQRSSPHSEPQGGESNGDF